MGSVWVCLCMNVGGESPADSCEANYIHTHIHTCTHLKFPKSPKDCC